MPVPTTFGVISAGSTATTLNPSDTAGTITLSTGNLRAAKNSGSDWAISRATSTKTAGLWYFEAKTIVTVTNLVSTGCGVGIANSSAVIGTGNRYLGNDNNSCGVLTDGFLRQGGAAGIIGGTSWGTANDVCCIAVDLTSRKLWFRKGPAGNWNASGTANPATGVGGYTLAAPLSSGAVYPAVCVCLNTTPDTVQINFGATAFSGAIPSGYTAWG